MKLKEKETSLLEEAIDAIRKKFIENPINRIILAHLYNLAGWHIRTTEEIKQAVITQCVIIPDNNPEVTLDDIFDRSIEDLLRDGLIEKTDLVKIGYRITQTGRNVASLFQKIEAYAVFERELKIKEELMKKISA